MEFPQDYFGSAADRSHALAARRLVLRDTRKEVRPPQASVQPYHPYAHEQWRSRLHATNPQQQQQQQAHEQQNGHVVNHQERRYVPTPTGHVGAAPAASPAALSSSYRRILLLGPSHAANASDRLVSLQNPRNNYYASAQYLASRGGGAGCENEVGREAALPQYFRREVVRRESDREKVTVNFLAAMASRRMEMSLPRAKDMDDGDKSKYAGLDFFLKIPGNTGSIARTCAASAVGLHLVGPLGYKIEDSKLKRAGLDYWPYPVIKMLFHLLPIIQNESVTADLNRYVVVKVHNSWSEFHDYFKQQDGEKRLLAFTKRGTHIHSDFSYKKGDWLVFGSETTGLPPQALMDCSTECLGGGTIRIPMIDTYVRCLNLSVSVGIAVYEAARQLNYEQLQLPLLSEEASERLFSSEDIFG
ncbi:hypothetical protein ZIOFF_074239 [Zingiber officinale]|uniref:tRNA/rRNA methyltransferase SpoU type domain-containing protein n=1 Tax=Zingiber officinale TaxID=94328 RepID=A0A8J5EAV3_ZINOF|nr:hypothetical protein ZIOFF_074239 [Zingiber officinale]